jgi:hypothetical protein
MGTVISVLPLLIWHNQREKRASERALELETVRDTWGSQIK